MTVPSLNRNGCNMCIGATGQLGLVVFCLLRVPLDAAHLRVVLGWARGMLGVKNPAHLLWVLALVPCHQVGYRLLWFSGRLLAMVPFEAMEVDYYPRTALELR